jgi:hypothetical protein
MASLRDTLLQSTGQLLGAAVEQIEAERGVEKHDSVAKPSDLCDVCFQALRLKGESILSRSRFSLGSLQDLEARGRHGRCSLCHLILSKATEVTTSRQALQQIDKDIVLRHTSGRKVAGSTLREILVTVDEILVCQLLYSLVRDEGGQLHTKDGKQALPWEWFNIITRTQGTINLENLKFCLSECETRHRTTCTEGMPFHGKKATTPILLVDVETQSLVEMDTNARYLCLSYHWNTSVDTMFLATSRNVAALKAPGGLKPYLSSVARTVQDAMDVVKGIGERFLWVDTLGVLQDDETLIAAQINNMHLIYSSSLATIIDMCGSSAHDGLFGVRQNTRPSPCALLDTGPYRICCRPADLDSISANHRYESRGWTYQERLLSKRCLVFTDNEVHFICPAGGARESLNGQSKNVQRPFDVYRPLGTEERPKTEMKACFSPSANRPGTWLRPDAVRNTNRVVSDILHYSLFSQNVLQEYARADGRLTEESLESKKSETAKLFIRAQEGINRAMRKHSPDEEELRLIRLFYAYRSIVTTYTRRTLTMRTDVLRAFGGIIGVLGRIANTSFVAGLPIFALDLALLWTPVGAQSLLRPSSESTASSVTDGPSGLKIPSWSWASQTGKIDFLIPHAWDPRRYRWPANELAKAAAEYAVNTIRTSKHDDYHSPVTSEVTLLGVQQRGILQTVLLNSCTSVSLPRAEIPVRLKLCTAAPADTTTLHLHAQVLPLSAFQAAGGLLIATDAVALDPNSVVGSESSKLAQIFKGATGLEHIDYARARPKDGPSSKSSQESWFYSYFEVNTAELLDADATSNEATDSLQLILLGKIKRFPPSRTEWEHDGGQPLVPYYYRPWNPGQVVSRWMSWGVLDGYWKAGNVMIVRTKRLVTERGTPMRLAERVGVSHVNLDHWARAASKTESKTDSWEYVVLE